MGANIAGIYGAQIFRRDDRPRYRRAFAVACAVLAVGLLIAIGRYISERLERRKKARQIDETSSTEGETPTFLPSDEQPAPIVDGRTPSLTTAPVSEGRRPSLTTGKF